MKSFSEIVLIVEAKQMGSHWRATCKAHGGDRDTLSLSQGDDGRALFKCFKGCSVEEILRAYGLEWGDVLPEKERTQRQQPPKSAKTTWTIRDINGNEVAQHTRVDDGNGKRFFWTRNGKMGLDGLASPALPFYRSEYLKGRPPGDVVVVCEGEKAADAANAKLGMLAVGTICGALSVPAREVLETLRGFRVLLWPDFDEPGIEHMTKIAEGLKGIASAVRWISIPDAKPKADAADFSGAREDIRKFIGDHPPELKGVLVPLHSALAAVELETQRILAGDFSGFISTGLSNLDRKLDGGFKRGTVTLIGAPSGAGKSTLVMQFSMAAQKYGHAVVVSPEMSKEELLFREVVRRSGHPKNHLTQWASPARRTIAAEAHARARADLADEKPNLSVYDAMHVTLPDVVTATRAAHKKNPIAFLSLDYAQHLADIESNKRHIAVGEVVQVGTELAREFNCAVLVTSQVNVYKDGRETNYSFRESAIMEHKAHLVLLFIVERDPDGEIAKSCFKLRKARDIQFFGDLEVTYDPATFSIRDRAAGWMPPPGPGLEPPGPEPEPPVPDQPNLEYDPV